jgi:branched-chain amino acid transport system permease protein
MIQIEHNMDVIMDVSELILVMDHGDLIADATPAEIRNDPDVCSTYLGAKPITPPGNHKKATVYSSS